MLEILTFFHLCLPLGHLLPQNGWFPGSLEVPACLCLPLDSAVYMTHGSLPPGPMPPPRLIPSYLPAFSSISAQGVNGKEKLSPASKHTLEGHRQTEKNMTVEWYV